MDVYTSKHHKVKSCGNSKVKFRKYYEIETLLLKKPPKCE